MNEAGAIPLEEPRRKEGWSRSKWITVIVLIFGAHVGLIIAMGDRKPITPRPVANVPHLQVAAATDEFIALNDPALFALPGPRDFAAVVWAKSPALPQPSFRWTETPRWLAPDADQFGAAFGEFMRTNRFREYRLHFKPAPRLSTPAFGGELALATDSTLRVEGALAQRQLTTPKDLPAIEFPGVLPASRVQVLVDADGFVVSAVVLPNDNADADSRSDDADQAALKIVRALHFAPASGPAIGRIFIHWHTVPPTNATPE